MVQAVQFRHVQAFFCCKYGAIAAHIGPADCTGRFGS